jgi:hypothetical protein
VQERNKRRVIVRLNWRATQGFGMLTGWLRNYCN